jgi:RNA polymerase sigma-70 factor (ECF subfamily)
MHLDTLAPVHVKSLSTEDEDRDLAVRFARGESTAFEEVVERHGQRVIGLAARLLGWRDGAEDVAQEVFLAALRNQKRFRGQSSLWTWLARITVNRCRTLGRRRWVFEKFAAATGWNATDADKVPVDEHAIREEQGAAVRRIVAGLPAKHREVIVLHYLEELPVSEIAKVLGLRRNAVEVRLSRARKLLEPLLADLTADDSQ